MAAQTWATVGALIGDRDSPVFPVRKVHFQPIVQGSLSPSTEPSVTWREPPSFRQESAYQPCVRFRWLARVSGIDDRPSVRDPSLSPPFPGVTLSRTTDYLRHPGCHWRRHRAYVPKPGAELWVHRRPRFSQAVLDELSANPLELNDASRISQTVQRCPLDRMSWPTLTGWPPAATLARIVEHLSGTRSSLHALGATPRGPDYGRARMAVIAARPTTATSESRARYSPRVP